MDRVPATAREVTLRLVFDDPRYPDFDLELWTAGDEARRDAPTAASCAQAANQWLARVEAIVRRPRSAPVVSAAPPPPAPKVAKRAPAPPPEDEAPPWDDDDEAPDLFDAGGMAAGIALVEALKKTNGDPAADPMIAALEGMSFEGPKGAYTFRKEDHQALQPMYMVKLLNITDPDKKFFELVKEVSAQDSAPPVIPPKQ